MKEMNCRASHRGRSPDSRCRGSAQRDREAAERLHQRARAIGDARHLVGFVLHVGDALASMRRAHLVFERERLDDAHALQGLLQGLDDARAAGELDCCMIARTRRISLRSTNSAGGTTISLTSDITGSWITMTATEADQGEKVAAERGDQQIEHWLAAAAPVVQPRDEFGGMAVGKEADVLAQQLVEHAALVFGDDAIADARQHDRVAVGQRCP